MLPHLEAYIANCTVLQRLNILVAKSLSGKTFQVHTYLALDKKTAGDLLFIFLVIATKYALIDKIQLAAYHLRSKKIVLSFKSHFFQIIFNLIPETLRERMDGTQKSD